MKEITYAPYCFLHSSNSNPLLSSSFLQQNRCSNLPHHLISNGCYRFSYTLPPTTVSFIPHSTPAGTPCKHTGYSGHGSGLTVDLHLSFYCFSKLNSSQQCGRRHRSRTRAMTHCKECLQVTMYGQKGLLLDSLFYSFQFSFFLPFIFYFVLGMRLQRQKADVRGQENGCNGDA